MLAYYFNLALRSFRRNKVLTALMVLAIALGIGACMTTLTVFYVLSGDPIPAKSGQLYYVRMDPAGLEGHSPGDPPEEQMTRYDSEALLRDAKGDRQAMMSGGNVAIEPDKDGLTPFTAEARFTSSDFFAMFDVPLVAGRAWTKADDEARANVAVITRALAERLFGGTAAVGKSVQMNQVAFEVVGVVDTWRPVPRFYDLTGERFGEGEEVFVPFSTSRAHDWGSSGNMNCWGSSNDAEGSTGPTAPCAWVQYWVELGDAGKAADYKRYLDNYSDQQRTAGRFQRPTNTRLTPVMGWLEENNVVPGDVRLQAWLAFGFLAVCLLNTVGLLLAKFLRRGGEIGVRRALGASRRAIFTQCLVEAATVGLAGGIGGLLLSLGGLWLVRQQPVGYAELARLDPLMLAMTFALALVASIVAGLLPAWRAMQIAPSVQLKSQ